MAKVHDGITPDLQAFMESQQLFFVATAPLSAAGRVNLSPKGLDCFRVLSPERVAYLDLTGSGNETSAHLLENGRITFLFCAFNGSPLILRLYGQGQTLLPQSGEWDSLVDLFPSLPGSRQIITATITRVQTSCGMGVPLFEPQGQRSDLLTWATHKTEAGLETYRQTKNSRSMDGLISPLAKDPA